MTSPEGGSPEGQEPAEEILSPDALRAEVAQLQQTVAAGQADFDALVLGKLKGREELIAVQRETDNALQQAKDALGKYAQLEKTGGMTADAEATMRELSTTIDTLTKRMADLRSRVDQISGVPVAGNEIGTLGIPGVEEKLREEAKSEDALRERERDIRETHERLDPEIAEIADQIKNSASRKLALANRLTPLEEKVHQANAAVATAFERASVALGKNSELKQRLQTLLRDVETPKDEHDGDEHPAPPNALLTALQEERRSYGLLGHGKEKKALDDILSQKHLFEQWSQAIANRDVVKQQVEALQVELGGIASRYRDVLLQAWETQRHVNDQTGTPHKSGLPNDLIHKLRKHMERMADLQRHEGTRQVGKYTGWNAAVRDPANNALYHVWEYIQLQARETSLGYRDPALDSETA